MRIAIQGEIGSFHDAATQRFFSGKDYELLPKQTFRSVFSALDDETADLGIVAVENSLYGSIHEVFDQLVSSKVYIIGEITIAIHQQLVGFDKVKLADITEVYSHPAALDQCRDWLEQHLPNAVRTEHHDTAGAVKYIRDKGLKNSAAIASKTASDLYGMAILSENIEDESDNFTRFVVISKKPKTTNQANKTSLILVTSHAPGALYDALGVFKKYDVNLTKLESRPIRGERFKYQFIVDALASKKILINIVAELELQNCHVTILGHYKSA